MKNRYLSYAIHYLGDIAEIAGSVAELAYYVREGNGIAKTAAIISTMSSFTKKFVATSYEEGEDLYFTSMGWEKCSPEFKTLLGTPTHTTYSTVAKGSINHWGEEIAAMVPDDRNWNDQTEVWVANKDSFHDYVWGVQDNMFWVKTTITNKEAHVVAIKDDNEYVGHPTIDEIALEAEGAESVFFWGPSGVGKTTLAVKLAKHKFGDDVKVMIIDGTSTIKFELVQYLRPDVVVLDDLDPRKTSLLQIIPRLKENTKLVISTIMDDKESDGEPGCNYIPGMRPGRVEVIIRFLYPDVKARSTILETYLGYRLDDELVELTEFMTGAYLQELARRIKLQTKTSPALDTEVLAIITLLKAQMPSSLFNEDEDDDDVIELTNKELKELVKELK